MTFEPFGEPQWHTDGELLQLTFATDGTLWTVEDPGILRSWDTQTGRQREWHARWRGQVAVGLSVDEALALIGVVAR